MRNLVFFDIFCSLKVSISSAPNRDGNFRVRVRGVESPAPAPDKNIEPRSRDKPRIFLSGAGSGFNPDGAGAPHSGFEPGIKLKAIGVGWQPTYPY